MNRLVRSAGALMFAFAGLTEAAPLAYVPNEETGTISIIDTEKDTVIGDIKAGDKPRGLGRR